MTPTAVKDTSGCTIVTAQSKDRIHRLVGNEYWEVIGPLLYCLGVCDFQIVLGVFSRHLFPCVLEKAAA